MMKRVVFDILLFGSVFFVPWWGVFALALYGAWRFSFYYEILIARFCLDILYGATGMPFIFGFGVLGMVCGAAMLLVFERVKQEVRS